MSGPCNIAPRSQQKREAPDIENLGCWEDTSDRAIATLEGVDDRLDGTYTAREDAINKCKEAAFSRGYAVFALQAGGWCAASRNAEDTYQKYGTSDNCAGDGEGGGWANQVYRILNVPAPNLDNLGCWTDTSDRAIPTLEGQDDILDGDYVDREDAITKCKEAALSRGFTVFALQGGGWCASSANAEDTYQMYGASEDCLDDGEGGSWANQVYRIQIYDQVEDLGCWTDTATRAIGTLEGKDDRLDGAYSTREDPITKCRDAAFDRGYSVFAIQAGGWCASSVIAEDTYQKYGEADNCADDGEGGGWANQVYRIKNAPASDLENLGCWTDTSARAIPTLEGEDDRLDGSYTAREDAINKCKEAAKSRGFSVFAIQAGGWCASSADAEDTYQMYGEADNCAGDGEGGGWANQVYRIIDTSAIVTEAPPEPTEALTTMIPTLPPCEYPADLTNVALGKPASQSSIKKNKDGGPEKAVDGNKDSDLKKGNSCTFTDREYQPRWEVDLEESFDIYEVIITNRQDCCTHRIKNAEIRVGDSENFEDNPVCGMMVLGKMAKEETIPIRCGCETPMRGRYVSIQLIDREKNLNLCEVEVMAN
ncbi:uncharacterized protein [Ptychodera flava]|uniref:uncharacterized protein n=1 Tax=Ptychodera flava TaxID=63121 RepID=UPI00396A634A